MDQNHTESPLANYTELDTVLSDSHPTKLRLAKSFEKSLDVLHSIFLPKMVVHVMIQRFWGM